MKKITSVQSLLTIGALSLALAISPLISASSQAISLSSTSGSVDGGEIVTFKADTSVKFKEIIASPAPTTLTADGSIYMWGWNMLGGLGNGTTVNASTPVKPDMTGVLAGKSIVNAVGTGGSTLVLASDGKLYSWGMNGNGELGNGNTTGSSVPVAVDMSGVLNGKTITKIAGFGGNCFVITSDGRLYGWGAGSFGQLGNNLYENSSIPVAVDMTGVLSGKTIVDVFVFDAHVIVLTSDKKLYSWGSNFYGNLGSNTPIDDFSATPKAVYNGGVLAGESISKVAASKSITLVLTESGKLFSWGNGNTGQLGNGILADSAVPVAVDMTGILSGKTIVDITAGSSSGYALDSNGIAYSWGSNHNNELGAPTVDPYSATPIAIDATGALAGKTVSKIIASGNSAFAIDTSGALYSWGGNSFGILGTGNDDNAQSPVAISTSGILSGKVITQLLTPYYTTFAIDSDGVLYSWGYGSSGELGNGSTENSNTPTRVVAPVRNAVSVALDGIEATNFSETNGDVSFTTPAHAQGLVDVTITYSDGTNTTIPNGYRYIATDGGTTTTPEGPSDGGNAPATPGVPNTGALYGPGSQTNLIVAGVAGALILVGAALLVRRLVKRNS